ncbi:hypothetical protein WR25_08613 isoform A [Diploscapter pachys]|uniref:Endoplasmic reticulum-Golgi intermediate compartment protein 3 n=1 Tax=Diploscapter pachys TaxID=2018661 RepID=A0A2A2L0L6_9BILA|nr:hypothetical protein WR25_08613 isoform A [Diploscapter pachys]
MVSIFSMVREFDAYTKPMEDFRVKTLSGGFVTLIASIVIICLTVLETYSFLSTEVVEQLYVDSSTSDIRVDIHFDIIFHRLPCGFVTVDVMDVSSDTQENIQHDIYKLRIDKNGLNISDTVQKMEANTNKSSVASASPSALPACGSCYGALPEGSCCNTCDEVKNAYAGKGWQVNIEEVEQCKSDEYLKQYTEQKGEGCRVYGKVQVAKVAGNFHFAPGEPYRTHRSHVHDLHSIDPSKFDASHTIHHFSFGKDYPGKAYPLDGKHVDQSHGELKKRLKQ